MRGRVVVRDSGRVAMSSPYTSPLASYHPSPSSHPPYAAAPSPSRLHPSSTPLPSLPKCFISSCADPPENSTLVSPSLQSPATLVSYSSNRYILLLNFTPPQFDLVVLVSIAPRTCVYGAANPSLCSWMHCFCLLQLSCCH